jgi:hypothetical protein
MGLLSSSPFTPPRLWPQANYALPHAKVLRKRCAALRDATVGRVGPSNCETEGPPFSRRARRERRWAAAPPPSSGLKGERGWWWQRWEEWLDKRGELLLLSNWLYGREVSLTEGDGGPAPGGPEQVERHSVG